MRVAYIANPESPNGWYRGIGPAIALAQRGHDVREVVRPGRDYRADSIRGCDVVLIHREYDERAQRVIRFAKENGIAVVWDNDDDLTAVPRGAVGHKQFGGLSGTRALREIAKVIAAADLVTTPSRVLAERFRTLGAHDVRVLENYVPDTSLNVRPRRHDGLVVGWLAGDEHRLDVSHLRLRETLGRLLDAHGEVELTTIGVNLGLRHPRYRHVTRVPFAQLPEALAEFDIGIAPIADVPFNRARSDVKLKEYASVGVPWLASAVGPYIGLGEREGGRLVDNDWFSAVEHLVVRPRERRRLARRAARWGRRQTISRHVGEWEAALSDVAARRPAA